MLSTLQAKDGTLTRELVKTPAKFGLGLHPEKWHPDAVVESVCGFCSTGCNLSLHVKDGRAVNLTPSKRYPVNQGHACPKGWEALTPLGASDRALTPLLRRDGKLQPVSWDQALKKFVENFKRIQESHGPDSLAFLSTGQIATEEMATLGAIAKFGMGIRHGDGNTRQCMATSVMAYKEAFGFDAPPFTYGDFEESDVLIFIGANPCIAHPILWERVCKNKRNPEIVVVDPRKTETAMQARMHVALNPKSDLYFLYGLAKTLIQNEQLDSRYIENHTEGFAPFKKFLETISMETVLETTGIPREAFSRLASLFENGKRVSLWWTMGVNQGHEAVRTAQAIINLCLMTGNIGRPGTGPNSITGQTNAMGSRLFSNTTNLLGGRNFTDATHRMEVADILNIPVKSIPHQNSLAYNEILDAVDRGTVKGLWVIATNPAHSWIHNGSFDKLMDKLEFLVVQDMYDTTHTAQYADLVLPAAAWGEKEGTVINSERRIGRIRKASRAPGKALADFHIFKLVAEYWGCGEMFKEWSTPEDVFQILKKLSKGRPCDFSGIEDYTHIGRNGGIQWPFTGKPEEIREKKRDPILEGESEKLSKAGTSGISQDNPKGLSDPMPEPSSGTTPIQERRLFSDGRYFTPNGRATFCFEQPKELYEPTDEEYPLTLLTGRGSSAQWHTQTRTEKSPILKKLAPAKPYVEIHPEDAASYNIENGKPVTIQSRRGNFTALANFTQTVNPGQIFVPMHYEGVNALTYPAFDPISKQPSYKACAVRVYP